MHHITCEKGRAKRGGFTLIEVLIVIGIIGILAAVVLVAINPSHQFKLARDSQRISNVNAILNAFGQNLADNKGVLNCGGYGYGPSTIPSVPEDISAISEGANLVNCLVPTYISSLPYDPSGGDFHYTSPTDYDTGYTVSQDPDTGRITVAGTAELPSDDPISVTR